MSRADIAFTPAIKRAQELRGSREAYAKMVERRDFAGPIDDKLADFVAGLDHFFLGTASADGSPYIQHRGGPAGFLKVLDEDHLAFADFAGNRQYITVGNLSENERAFLFLIDYPTQRRMKVWGRAKVVEDDPELLAQVTDPTYRARPERVIVFEVETWHTNCHQHITPRYTSQQIQEMAQ